MVGCALFAMNIAQYVALNSVFVNMHQIEANCTRQEAGIAKMFQHLEVMGEMAAENFGYIKFLKKQMDEVHLRMAAQDNVREVTTES